MWRVTLASDGAPWVFDSIHNCGCYHQFFPTARAVPKAQHETLHETAFVPQTLPRLEAGARVVLRLEAGTSLPSSDGGTSTMQTCWSATSCSRTRNSETADERG